MESPEFSPWRNNSESAPIGSRLLIKTNPSVRNRKLRCSYNGLGNRYLRVWRLTHAIRATIESGNLYLEVLVSLPQHSGRRGSSELSHPPPKAWTSSTAFTMRRPRTFTE